MKDLHSRVSVAIQAVDAISKRIEKIRDEELQPQLVELIQGYIYLIDSISYTRISNANLPVSFFLQCMLVKIFFLEHIRVACHSINR